jgi:UDP-glucuronate decarboxylase
VTGPINLGNPDEFSIVQLAERVVAGTGGTGRIVHRDLPGDDPKQRQPDIAKAREVLGWTPGIPLDEGLPRTIDYFRELLGPQAVG